MRTKTVRTYARGYCTIVKTNVSLRLCVILFLKFEKYPRKNIVEIRRVVGLGVGEFSPLTRRIRRVVGLGVGEFFRPLADSASFDSASGRSAVVIRRYS